MAWNRRTLLATGIGSVGSLLLGREAHARRSSPEPGGVSGSGARDNRVALVIATQRYQYHDQIETAYNDARAMGRALTERGGFSLVGDKVHVDRRQATVVKRSSGCVILWYLFINIRFLIWVLLEDGSLS